MDKMNRAWNIDIIDQGSHFSDLGNKLPAMESSNPHMRAKKMLSI